MLLTHCANTIRSTCWHTSATSIAEVWIRNPSSIRSKRVRRRRDLRELLPYHHRVWIIYTYIYNFISFRNFVICLYKIFLCQEKELFSQVLPILKTPFPLLDRATLPWTAMEAIKVVTRVARPVAHRQTTRRHHLGHPVKAAHPPPIKVHFTVYNPLTVHAIRFIFTYRFTYC